MREVLYVPLRPEAVSATSANRTAVISCKQAVAPPVTINDLTSLTGLIARHASRQGMTEPEYRRAVDPIAIGGTFDPLSCCAEWLSSLFTISACGLAKQRIADPALWRPIEVQLVALALYGINPR